MSVVFYYDIVCPFAYMASHLVEKAVARAGGKVLWTPVLLAGLYRSTNAPQGTGSATDVMAPNKLNIVNQDLRRQLFRNGVPVNMPDRHPQKTLHAMRVLAGVSDHALRIKLSKAFFKAYWQDGVNVENHKELQQVVDQHTRGIDVTDMISSDTNSQLLRSNSDTAAERGAFGVPSFYVNDKLVWGTDRLFFVERYLGRAEAEPERLMHPPPQGGHAKLTFYFDFASPWAFLGHEILDKTIRSVHPIKVELELVPILLGGLFKTIGTHFVPAEAMAPAKMRYGMTELTRYSQEVIGTHLVWPDNFPLRTILPQRVAIVSGCDRNIMTTIFRAAWQQNKNIGDAEVLAGVLSEAGLPAQDLIQATQSQNIKDQLMANTTRAVNEGLCGVPSYQVNNGPVIWGQDKLNIVADMMCGWKDSTAITSKL